MSCPTCEHTMQCVGKADYVPQFWCSRCGTITGGAVCATDRVPTLADAYLDVIDVLDKLFVESVKCDNIAKNSTSSKTELRYWSGRAHGIREAVTAIRKRHYIDEVYDTKSKGLNWPILSRNPHKTDR